MPGGEGTPYSGLYGEAPPERGDFLSLQNTKGWENCHSSIWKGHKIRCKVEKMAAKTKYMKGCQILADMTTRNTLWSWATESERLKFNYLGLSLGYEKGVQFCSWYMKGVPLWWKLVFEPSGGASPYKTLLSYWVPPGGGYMVLLYWTKLNARLALRQRADLFKANISANKISLPQGQSYRYRRKML